MTAAPGHGETEATCKTCGGSGYTQERGLSGAAGDPSPCLMCPDGEMYREMEAKKVIEKKWAPAPVQGHAEIERATRVSPERMAERVNPVEPPVRAHVNIDPDASPEVRAAVVELIHHAAAAMKAGTMTEATGRGEGGDSEVALVPCINCEYDRPAMKQWFPNPEHGWMRECPGCKRCTGQHLFKASADRAWNEMNRRASQPAASGGGEGAEVELADRMLAAIGMQGLLSFQINRYQIEAMARAALSRSKEGGVPTLVSTGWDCPQSPSGKCEYEGGDLDSCDHCGQPEERK